MMLGLLKGLLSSGKKRTSTEVVVYDLPAGQRDSAAAVNVRRNEVAIFRPPVVLDARGQTMPGVSKQLVARYLVSTTAALAEADLGPVSVEWVEQEGRFVSTRFTIHAWGQEVEIVHPVAPVSQELANAWEVYMGGTALKVRELHKGHQRFDQANATIKRASRKLTQLRDAPIPQFSDAEFLFLQAAMQQAMVMSALVPVGEAPAEEVVGTRTDVAGM